MKRTCTAIATAALLALALAAPASASFGLKDVDVAFTNEDGSPAIQAGSHPFAMTTTVDFKITGAKLADGEVKDLIADLPPGLIGDPTAVPRCSNADFLVFTNAEGSACSEPPPLGWSASARKGKPTAAITVPSTTSSRHREWRRRSGSTSWSGSR